jgi:hypothetical protein
MANPPAGDEENATDTDTARVTESEPRDPVTYRSDAEAPSTLLTAVEASVVLSRDAVDGMIDAEQGLPYDAETPIAAATTLPATTTTVIPVEASFLVSATDELPDELPVVLADAVFLEEAPDTSHTVGTGVPASAEAAVPATRSDCLVTDGVQTIQLGNDSIMSVRDMNRDERPEYLCVILRNCPDYNNPFDAAAQGVLGLSVTTATDGQLRVDQISTASPFTASPVATRDVLLSINNSTCRGLSPDQVLANLLQAVTSVDADSTTIRLRNEGGNSQRVATTVEKPHKEALLGVTFGLNEHASVAITSVKPNNVLVSSLLNPGDRLISVNEHDCTNVAPSAIYVAHWIREAPRFVTIVTEPATSTAVVIAVGDAALGDSVLPAHGASSHPERHMSDENKKRIVCSIIFGGILIVLLAVLAALSGSPTALREGAGTDDFIFSETPDGRFFSLCDQVKVLNVDGTPLRDTTNRAVNVGAPDCSPLSFIQTFSGAAWYTFRVADNQGVSVSTCSDSQVNTVLSAYGGSCTSPKCIGFSDDFGASNCGASSQIWISPGEGRDIFVQVVGYGGTEGDFGIKVETVLNRFDSNCLCSDEPGVPLVPITPFPPAPSVSPVPLGTPPTPPPAP